VTKGVPGNQRKQLTTKDTKEHEGLRTSADEVDDLEAVAFVERRRGPAVARDDVAVELDGDAVGFHAEGFDEGGESEGIGRVGEISRLSVDMKRHSALRRMNFFVVVRPSKLAWTSSEESGKVDSSTSILISADPPESATAWV